MKSFPRGIALVVMVGLLAGLLCGRAAFFWQGGSHAPSNTLLARGIMPPRPTTGGAPSTSGATLKNSGTISVTGFPAVPLASATNLAVTPIPTLSAPTPVLTAAAPQTSTAAILLTVPATSAAGTRVIPSNLDREAQAGLTTMAQKDASGANKLPFTILLAAVQPNGTASGDSNAAALVLGRIDPEKHIATWVALPADLLVQTPAGSNDRLDAVYAQGETLLNGGGAPYLKQTIEQNFQTPVQYYFVLTGEGVSRAIDRLGSLNVEIPYAVGDATASANPLTVAALLPAGPQSLDGASLFEYVRLRDRASEADHLKKMRALSDGFAQAAQKADALTQALYLVVELSPYYRTNLNPNQLLGLAQVWRSITADQMLLRQIDGSMLAPAPAPARALAGKWDKIRGLFAEWKR